MAISDGKKLQLFNAALRALEERQLASLDEDREPARLLEDAWRGEDLVVRALEFADWNFALRAICSVKDSSVETQFGFQCAHPVPDDFVRMSSLSSDERFQMPLTSRDYLEQGGYWLTDYETIYVRFVSSNLGLDASNWTQAFEEVVELMLAMEVSGRVTNSGGKQSEIAARLEAARDRAKAIDGFSDGPKMRPHGSWVASRMRGRQYLR